MGNVTGLGIRMCGEDVLGTEVSRHKIHEGNTEGCLEDWIKDSKAD